MKQQLRFSFMIHISYFINIHPFIKTKNIMDSIVKHTGPLFYVQAYSQEMDSLLLNHESYNLQNDPVLAEYLHLEKQLNKKRQTFNSMSVKNQKDKLVRIQREPLRQQAFKFNRVSSNSLFLHYNKQTIKTVQESFSNREEASGATVQSICKQTTSF